ncbi:MAG: LacI family transcriptional regulator [Paracoccus denitrificans]|uniref:LacI family transcriptional regulator n=1 Tax=Paracoccus denitrificans TaxID=266 RepID=A0A533I589_PARDE|nr:MAG: LacI family transcriptional regulator [Paracoccus denitrificans]
MVQPKRSSMQDIADALGVSRATVSNALLGKGRVSDRIASRVREKAKEMDYAPSGLGRALRTGRSQQVGLVLPDFRMPLFAEFARAFAMAARARGLVLTVADSLGDIEMQRSNVTELAARGMDAVLLVPMRGSSLNGLRLPTPLIVIDAETNPLNAVSSDHGAGGRLIAGHLAGLGHRDVLILNGGDAPASRVNHLRLSSIEETLRAFGVRTQTASLPLQFTAARDFVMDWQPGQVTAIAATYDTLAVGAIMALNERRIAVPDQISVAGFDDTVWGRITSPPLTTVRQDLDRVAELALARAMGEREGPDLVPVSLVARASTAAPQHEATNRTVS